MLSGLGAVYTEWVLKRNADALQWQNMQLYGLGVLVNTAGLMVNGGAVLACVDVLNVSCRCSILRVVGCRGPRRVVGVDEGVWAADLADCGQPSRQWYGGELAHEIW